MEGVLEGEKVGELDWEGVDWVLPELAMLGEDWGEAEEGTEGLLFWEKDRDRVGDWEGDTVVEAEVLTLRDWVLMLEEEGVPVLHRVGVRVEEKVIWGEEVAAPRDGVV